MILELSIAAYVLSLVCVALAFWWATPLAKLYRSDFQRQDRNRADNTPGPVLKSAVILPVRGADPFLAETIRELLAQDHSDYHVFVIVDHFSDPAYNVVHEEIEAASKRGVDVDRLVSIEVLAEPPTECSPKLAGQLQVIDGLDECYKALVFLDADVRVYPTWLQEMTEQLAEEEIGATSGVRWYLPDDNGFGSIVRYLWNAGSAPPMHHFRVMFGGSMAIRRDVFERADFAGAWSKSLFEDTQVAKLAARDRKKVRFIPTATLINRESVKIGGCLRFIRRQVRNLRLYHPSFFWVFLACALNTTALVGSLVVGGIGAAVGNWPAVAWSGLAFATMGLGHFLSIAWCGYYAREAARRRGETVRGIPAIAFPAALLTQLLYTGCVVAALFSRRERWRGLDYRIRGPYGIELLKYEPYQQAAPRTAGTVAESSL